MLEEIKNEKMEEVAGGKQIKTTCCKCGKEITLTVADAPRYGFPAPMCTNCGGEQSFADLVESMREKLKKPEKP